MTSEWSWGTATTAAQRSSPPVGIKSTDDPHSTCKFLSIIPDFVYQISSELSELNTVSAALNHTKFRRLGIRAHQVRNPVGKPNLKFCKEIAPSVPRTRAAAALRMKKMALDNTSRTIRRLRAKLATESRESAATKEGLETKESSLERDLQIQRCDNHSLRNMVTLYHKDIDCRISQLIEAKKEHKSNQARESHLECPHKLQARIQEAEDTIQEQCLIIEDLVEEKASLLQTIQGLQEDNGAPAPFDDEWEEEPEEDPEEEGLEDIPVGEGEIVD
ncbi:pleiotropic drug resistance protein 3-like [Dorcoceras hygrometricum]|uniref:Pleiotropic drug resistance protein 3-like n=1 Tax=Dorcoceras hygrometricum TaxID=472368 RepID=A0A2Z7CR43_9LAMI|nr:pleiotropic drug resistance protein 3-like [Dorcoceras hygrometricum]